MTPDPVDRALAQALVKALNDSLAREGRLGNEIDALRALLREARTHVHTLDDAWVGPWCARVATALGQQGGKE